MAAKRILTAAIAAGLMFGFVGTTSASAKPGSEDAPSNKHGKCTAYFNGEAKEGDSWDRFLQDAQGYDNLTPGNEDIVQWVDDGDGVYEAGEELPGTGEQSNASDAYEYCTSDGGEIGGQPEHNGAYDCEEPSGAARDVDTDGEIECYDNTGGTGTWVDTAWDEENDPNAETGGYDTGGDHPGNGNGKGNGG